MIELNINDRTELQKLRRGAEKEAKKVFNPSWKRAWLKLSDALDRLDAMTARNTEK